MSGPPLGCFSVGMGMRDEQHGGLGCGGSTMIWSFRLGGSCSIKGKSSSSSFGEKGLKVCSSPAAGLTVSSFSELVGARGTWPS